MTYDAISLRTLAVLGTGGLLTVLAATRPAPERQAPTIAVADPTPAATSAVAADDAPRATPYDLHFTFTAGGSTWVALADAPDASHTTARTASTARIAHDDSGDWFSIAALREPPASARAWLDREVLLDGGCRESLHDFAVIGMVSGDPEGDGNGHWTARSIAEQGNTVLAAKLTHCSGALAGAFASIAPFQRVISAPDAALTAHAKALLLASPFATKAAADWRAMGIDHPWLDDVTFDTVIAADAGTTYVSVHVEAGGIGCGSPTANFWGLYRVGANNALEQLQLREVDFDHLDSMIDIDGRVGFLGQALFPAGPILVDSSGETRASLVTPYLGCPC